MKKAISLILAVSIVLCVFVISPLSASAKKAELAETSSIWDSLHYDSSVLSKHKITVAVGETTSFSAGLKRTSDGATWMYVYDETFVNIADRTHVSHSFKEKSDSSATYTFRGLKEGDAHLQFLTLYDKFLDPEHKREIETVLMIVDVRVTVTAASASSNQNNTGSNNTSSQNSNSSNTNSQNTAKLLATPKITKFTSTKSGLKIAWGAVGNAKKYRVFKKVGSKWKGVATVSGTAFLDKNVVYNQTYTYTVRCVNAAGTRYTSGYYRKGWSRTFVKIVATPRIKKTKVGSQGVLLNWGGVSGASKYRVFYKNSNNKWTKLLDTTKNYCLVTNITLDKTYYYTVRCLTANGKNYTSAYNKTGTKVVYGSAPKILEVDIVDPNGALMVDIDCKSYKSMAYYKVWYYSGSKWVFLGDTEKDGRLLRPTVKLKDGKYYKFKAQGYDASGNPSTLIKTGGYNKFVWENY